MKTFHGLLEAPAKCLADSSDCYPIDLSVKLTDFDVRRASEIQ